MERLPDLPYMKELREIKVTVREYQIGQALTPNDATRQTLLIEEVEGVVAALAAGGMSAERINALLNRPDIKCLLPGQVGAGEVQK